MLFSYPKPLDRVSARLAEVGEDGAEALGLGADGHRLARQAMPLSQRLRLQPVLKGRLYII